MQAIGVRNWTLPARAGRLPDGRTDNTCPSAGICAQVRYAGNSTSLWPVARARHHANLTFVLDDLPGWEAAMTAELGADKFRRAWMRIHDAGDFVFPDEPAIAAAWSSQEASDLLAVLGPKLVGIPANRIPQFLRRLRGRRCSQWQRDVDAARDRRRSGPAQPAAPIGGNRPAAERHRPNSPGLRHPTNPTDPTAGQPGHHPPAPNCPAQHAQAVRAPKRWASWVPGLQ